MSKKDGDRLKGAKKKRERRNGLVFFLRGGASFSFFLLPDIPFDEFEKKQ